MRITRSFTVSRIIRLGGAGVYPTPLDADPAPVAGCRPSCEQNDTQV